MYWSDNYFVIILLFLSCFNYNALLHILVFFPATIRAVNIIFSINWQNIVLADITSLLMVLEPDVKQLITPNLFHYGEVKILISA